MSRLSLDDFPIWRKGLIIGGIVASMILGSIVVNRELDIYGSAPKTPNTLTGAVFPVQVMHGHVRYLNAQQYENLMFWRPLVGLPVLFVLFGLVTSSDFWRAVREKAN